MKSIRPSALALCAVVLGATACSGGSPTEPVVPSNARGGVPGAPAASGTDYHSEGDQCGDLIAHTGEALGL